MAQLSDFGMGDRVKHLSRNEEGCVNAIEDDGVHVLFDNPTPRGNKSVGIFDHDWFRAHPEILVNLSVKQATNEKRRTRSDWGKMGWHERRQTPEA